MHRNISNITLTMTVLWAAIFFINCDLYLLSIWLLTPVASEILRLNCSLWVQPRLLWFFCVVIALDERRLILIHVWHLRMLVYTNPLLKVYIFRFRGEMSWKKNSVEMILLALEVIVLWVFQPWLVIGSYLYITYWNASSKIKFIHLLIYWNPRWWFVFSPMWNSAWTYLAVSNYCDVLVHNDGSGLSPNPRRIFLGTNLVLDACPNH
jgi:hypothetical protein